MTQQHLYLEATLTPSDGEKTGREWEVTIIGAQSPDDLVKADGRTFIRSKNGRLYDTAAIAQSAPLWEGVKVYDNHLTQEEFEKKQGLRSPSKEWLGTIVKPRWEEAKNQLRGVFKVVEDSLAKKLKNAYEQGVLSAIGLSIDTFPLIGREVAIEGQRMPVIEGFKKILSVDLVGDPAAGGGFERLIAAHIHEEPNMDKEELKQVLGEILPDMVSGLVTTMAAEALAADEEDDAVQETETEEVEEEATAEAETEEEKDEEEAESEPEEAPDDNKAEAALRKAESLEFRLMLRDKLDAAKLGAKARRLVEATFDGRLATEKEVDTVIKRTKEAVAASDPSGQPLGAGGGRGVEVGLGEDDRFALEVQRIIMGNSAFNDLDKHDDAHVRERTTEAEAYKSWVNNGRPELSRYGKLSHLFYDYFGGDILINSRAYEAATTSSLATVVKNTVNIMVAADYSKRERWYEPLVNTEEVDTIDTVTLARLYGVSNLSVVDEGGPYTELSQEDEEETAAFVKRGNYIGVTLETLLRDKLNYIRTIPMRMSNAWYNTLSAQVAGVFTVNSNTGPQLADTGALFNATAVSSAGGHANLLTSPLSFSAYSSARTAMRVQTDQTSGNGRKLQIEPRFLLVPEDLETTAMQIRNSEMEPGTGDNDVNPFFQKFDVVVVPDWTDANDWALVGDPQQYPAIWLIFPRGQRTPQLFTAENESTGAMFTNDEIRYKVRMLTFRFSATYDCAPVSDFRPLHKNNV